MAQRRMFSKSITNSSQFLMMPQSSQNLYFHLGMNADDDGFCEHFSIMRMTDSKPDDLKVLQAKGYVNVFDDKVLVVIDWKENNYLRNDRYTPSKYLTIYKKELKSLAKSENKVDTTGIPTVDKVATQVRIGKVRIGKDNTIAEDGSKVNEFIDLFKVINPTYSGLFKRKDQRASSERLLKIKTIQDWEKIVNFIVSRRNDRYCPKISTPSQLEMKYADLETYAMGLKQEAITKKSNVAF
jgi:hypothetical protein